MASQGLGDVEALHVVGREARNGDVVVVDDELDVEVLRHGKPRRLGIVALLVGPVGALWKEQRRCAQWIVVCSWGGYGRTRQTTTLPGFAIATPFTYAHM